MNSKSASKNSKTVSINSSSAAKNGGKIRPGRGGPAACRPAPPTSPESIPFRRGSVRFVPRRRHNVFDFAAASVSTGHRVGRA
eukprot:1307742-Rhodomonas_salina.6